MPFNSVLPIEYLDMTYSDASASRYYAYMRGTYPGVYIHKASTSVQDITFTINGVVGAVGAYALVVTKWSGDSWTPWSVVAFGDVGGTTQVAAFRTGTSSDYGIFCFAISCPSATTGTRTLTATYTNNYSMFAVEPMPGSASVLSAAASYRLTAVSLLLTQTCQELYRGGYAYAAVVPPDQDWVDYTTSAAMMRLPEHYSGDLKLGCYGFTRPVNDADITFIPTADFDANGTLQSVSLNRNPNEYTWTVFLLDVSSQLAAGVYPGGLVNAVLNVGVEMVPNSTLLETARPRVSTNEWNGVRDALRSTPVFHENPLHISDLISGARDAIGAAGRAALKYGPGTLAMIEKIMKYI